MLKKTNKIIVLTLFTFIVLLLTGINDSFGLEQTEFKGQITKESIETSSQAEAIIEKNKSNLKENYKKMSTDLVRLVDETNNFIDLSRDQLKEDMKKHNQLVIEEISNDQDTGELVHVYIQMKPGSDIGALTPFVNKFENIEQENHLAVAWVDVSQLDALSALSSVKSIRTVIPPIINTITEGDDVLYASTFRKYEEVDGTGIKVGVISNGVDHWLDAKNSGDLPANLHVLRNTYGGDEGTAMLEIIHDLAPGAELYFYDCGDNELEFNSAVDALINAGCNIICDDIGWPGQPYFEDGIVAQHITAVLNNNVVYVSSAGNSAFSHYQGPFYDKGSGYNDFSLGSSNYKNLYVKIPVGGNVLVVLQWDDQFGHAANDYDLYLKNNSTGTTLTYSNDTQNGDDDPLEAVLYTNNTGASFDAAIDIKRRSGTAKNLEVYIFPSNGTGIYTNNITAGNSIFGHAAVPGVITTGTVNYPDVNTIAAYSSQGPITIKYPSVETRNKPDICGLAGVSVSGAGGFSSPFYGTSAAAPHVAAIAALTWSYNRAQTAAQVRSSVVSSVDDLGSTGYDTVFGFGRINALGIIATPELVIESLKAPDEINGSSFIVTDSVKNIGTAINENFYISYYLSTDNIIDDSDICIGKRDITVGLPARTGINSGTAKLTIPGSVTNGNYYIYMLVDPPGNISEVNQKNNSKIFGPITININHSSVISTIAGNGSYKYSGDNIPAISAQIWNPNGLAFDSSGNMYISDQGNNRIRKIDTSGLISTVAGNGINGYSGDGGPATEAALYGPYGVAIDNNGNLYIADYYNHRIRKADTSGKISTVAGTGVGGCSGDGGLATAAMLYWPTGITFDSKGNIYIADHGNSRIRKVDTYGKISTVTGNGTSGYSGDGGPATLAKINYPTSVTFDSSGNMFIADYGNHRIRKIDLSGKISTVAGTGEMGYSGDGGLATSAQLNCPFGVTFDNKGNLYIADQNNQRIRKVDTSGKIRTVAGIGVQEYSGDGGIAANAGLDDPAGVTFDNYGNLYIADSSNHRIRKVVFAAPQNSIINPTVANFDKNPVYQADIPVTVSFNGNTLSSITNGGIPLAAGNDYTVTGSVYTISKGYLASQPEGTFTLTFHFNAGSSQELLITVSDSTQTGVEIDYSQSTASIETPLTPGVNSTVTVTLKDSNGNLIRNTSKEISIAVSIVNNVTTTDEEYIVAGQVYTSSTDIPFNATSDDQGQITFDVLLPAEIDTGDGLSVQVKTVDGNSIGLGFGYPVKDECFIATAAYGSKFQPAVVLLRQFRDQFLLTNRVGREFVNFYYHNSPPIASFIASSEPLKVLVRLLLLPVIAIAYTAFHPALFGVLGVLILSGLLYRRKFRSRVA